MKKFLSTFAVAAAFIMSTAFSCGNEGDGPVTFPEKQTLVVEAGQESVLNFHADERWKIVSSAPWVKFIDGGMEVFDMSGEAGDQSVRVKVLDDGQGFEETDAEIKLNMAGTEKVIAEVRRGGKSYSVTVTDEDGNEVKELVITNTVYTVFHVKANFEFTSNALAQLDFMKTVAGEAEDDLKTGIMVKDEYITRPIAESDNVNLEIYNSDKEVVASYPIIYEGVDDSYISVQSRIGTKWDDNELYQQTVSADGRTFTCGFGKYDKVTGKPVDGTFTEKTGSVTLKVTVRNDAFRFIMLEADGNGQVSRPASAWIHAAADASDPKLVNVTVDPAGDVSRRTGAILAVPEAVFSTVDNDVATGAGYQTILSRYRANILIEAFQMDAMSQELDLRDGRTWSRLYGYGRITDALELAFCKEKFGTDNAFVTNVNAGTPLLIFTQYHESSIDRPDVFDGYEIYKTDGTLDKDMMDIKKSEYNLWDDWFMCYVNVKELGSRSEMYVKLKTKTPADGSERQPEKVLKVIVGR